MVYIDWTSSQPNLFYFILTNSALLNRTFPLPFMWCWGLSPGLVHAKYIVYYWAAPLAPVFYGAMTYFFNIAPFLWNFKSQRNNHMCLKCHLETKVCEYVCHLLKALCSVFLYYVTVGTTQKYLLLLFFPLVFSLKLYWGIVDTHKRTMYVFNAYNFMSMCTPMIPSPLR